MRKIKAVLSALLVICFILVMVTGLMTYFGKTGLILGIPRGYIHSVHTWSGFVMGAAVILHFILNVRIFKGEWRGFFKKK
jgi:cytochrome b subunit of formate dehydrogenase